MRELCSRARFIPPPWVEFTKEMLSLEESGIIFYSCPDNKALPRGVLAKNTGSPVC
jgi:hypothetical protein